MNFQLFLGQHVVKVIKKMERMEMEILQVCILQLILLGHAKESCYPTVLKAEEQTHSLGGGGLRGEVGSPLKKDITRQMTCNSRSRWAGSFSFISAPVGWDVNGTSDPVCRDWQSRFSPRTPCCWLSVCSPHVWQNIRTSFYNLVSSLCNVWPISFLMSQLAAVSWFAA